MNNQYKKEIDMFLDVPTNVFLAVLGYVGLRWFFQQSLHWDPASWFIIAVFWPVSEALSGTLKGHTSHPLRSHPSYISNPNFILKSSPANTMTLRERVQICGTQTLCPSRVLHLFCAPLCSFIVLLHTSNSCFFSENGTHACRSNLANT